MDVITYLPALNSAILGGSLLYYAHQNYKAKQTKRRVVEFYGSDTDSVINSKLSEIRFAFDADKAKIYQFHNGGVFIHGHSMKKMSLSYLQVKPGVSPPNISRLQNLPTTLFPNMVSRFLNDRGVIIWTTKNAPDSFVKSRHIEESIELVMLCGIWGQKGNLIGFISLNWLEERKFDVDQSLLIEFANDIGELMDNY